MIPWPALLILGATGGQPTPSVPPAPGEWALVWSDEFDGAAIDASKWNVQDAAISNNNELQYYTPGSATVADGVLTIRAERRPIEGRDFASSLIDTRGKFAQAFGRFECRAKLPRGRGIWPAFWMLPEAGGWPPEIDIMENLGHEPRRIHCTQHWGEAWPRNQSTGAHFDGPDFSEDFHVFCVEWSPERIDWLIDGERVASSTSHIPLEPFYLVVNLAVGGHWPGDPDATTEFPQELRVDWVRAYERREEGVAYLHLAGDQGSTLPDPPRWSYEPGASVRIIAEPDIGYSFSHWAGDASGKENPATIVMSQNRRVEAVFEPLPDGPRLLSRQRPARASSFERSGFEPARATDDSLWTRWSAAPGTGVWIDIDLGETRDVEAVRLVWSDAHPAGYVILVSDDQERWRPAGRVGECRGRTETIRGLNGTGRYVRLVCEPPDEKQGASLYTFEVYGR